MGGFLPVVFSLVFDYNIGEDMENGTAENTLLQTIINSMETMKHCMWVIRGRWV